MRGWPAASQKADCCKTSLGAFQLQFRTGIWAIPSSTFVLPPRDMGQWQKFFLQLHSCYLSICFQSPSCKKEPHRPVVANSFVDVSFGQILFSNWSQKCAWPTYGPRINRPAPSQKWTRCTCTWRPSSKLLCYAAQLWNDGRVWSSVSNSIIGNSTTQESTLVTWKCFIINSSTELIWKPYMWTASHSRKKVQTVMFHE